MRSTWAGLADVLRRAKAERLILMGDFNQRDSPRCRTLFAMVHPPFKDRIKREG